MKTEKYTLHTGAHGHRSWLLDRKNKFFLKRETDDATIMELCFAYASDPVELNKLKGKDADNAIKLFSIPLTDDDIDALSDHAIEQIKRFLNSSAVPKKKPVNAPRANQKSPRRR